MNTRPVLIAATAAGVGTFGWVAFRMYVRSRVVETLNTEYNYDSRVASISKLKPLGVDFKLPTAEELAASVTPIWSTVMPEAAIADISKRGRNSAYWPKAYKTGALSQAVEPYLLNILGKSSIEGSPEARAIAAIGSAVASLSK